MEPIDRKYETTREFLAMFTLDAPSVELVHCSEGYMMPCWGFLALFCHCTT